MEDGMKKKWKNLFGSIVFLAGGLTLTVLASYVLRPTDNDFFRDRFTGFYAEEDDSLDVVGLGGSALYRYFCSPVLYEEAGLTSYPLSTASQSVYAIENLIDEIKKTQSPQLYVIECRQFLFLEEKEIEESRARVVTDNMYYSKNRVSLINRLVEDWRDRLSYYFDIMVYHDNWENVNRESFSYALNSRAHPVKGWGNIALHKTLKTPDVKNVKEETPLSAASEEVLLELLEKCEEENLPVLFLLTPYRISKKDEKKANYLGRIVTEHGFAFLNCNVILDEIGMDYAVDFYNAKHTNSIGARKFSRFLADYILSNFAVEIDHTPKVLDSWDQALAAYEKRYEAVEAKVYERIAEEQTQAAAAVSENVT